MTKSEAEIRLELIKKILHDTDYSHDSTHKAFKEIRHISFIPLKELILERL